MPTNAIQVGLQQVGKVIKNNSPTILTALSVAGLISTVTLAVYATPKALATLRTAEIDRAIETKDQAPELTKVEKVKLVWKEYIPSATVGLATMLCIISANSINLRRNAALASIYTLTERAMQEYQAKVVETIGKNKEEKIKGEVDQDILDRNPVSKNNIVITQKGNSLCYDSLSGRYFQSDIEQIRKAQNDFNSELNKGTYCSLNEFYDRLGLPNIKMGQDIGWTTDHGMLDIRFDARIAEDERPCIVLDYRNGPVPII